MTSWDVEISSSQWSVSFSTPRQSDLNSFNINEYQMVRIDVNSGVKVVLKVIRMAPCRATSPVNLLLKITTDQGHPHSLKFVMR